MNESPSPTPNPSSPAFASPPDDLLKADKLIRMYREMEHRTLIMGILNVTPDSFSDGGLNYDADAAVTHAIQMLEDGADIIDVGGESTRPGAELVPVEEEIRRVVPVIERISKETDAVISIDTYKAKTAEAVLDAGASIVNDISALTFDPDMRRVVAEHKVPAIIMHIKGTPKDMQSNPAYDDLIEEVKAFLQQRIDEAANAGIDPRMLILDPGIGFGKTINHNLEIMRRLKEFQSFRMPILMGTSRKSTIGKVLGGLPPEERLEGTAATVAVSIMNGANIVRVHDVKQMARVAKMTDAIMRGWS
jgi:dihydropteroate synthase